MRLCQPCLPTRRESHIHPKDILRGAQDDGFENLGCWPAERLIATNLQTQEPIGDRRSRQKQPITFLAGARSVIKLQAELDQAWAAVLADLAEGAAEALVVGIQKLHVVKGVKHFCAKLETL